MKKQDVIREKISKLLKQFYDLEEKSSRFVPGQTLVRYSGGYFSSQEAEAVINTFLDRWLGLGILGDSFDIRLAKYLKTKKTLLTNSGSSASLLAMAALTSKMRPDPLMPGDEVITPACTFATTVSAIVHQGLVPRFVDIDLNTLNPTISMIEAARRKKTRAIFIPHTLGNPNDMLEIMKLARQNKLYVIEDNCDALGSSFNGKMTGTFGHLGTLSFYPAHHMTTAGEGGSVIINDLSLYKIILTLRNWGRGCWCLPSEKHPLGACKNRFTYLLSGSIPVDHRYYFTEMGYNLKPVELQAAMGLVQLKRFPAMAKARRRNFKSLYKFFTEFEKYFYLPQSIKRADPCWFSFPLTIRDKAPFSRNEILAYLANKKIEGRSLFAGNIIRHPAMRRVKYKVSGLLTNSDLVLKNTFFVGVWPGIGKEQIAYMKQVFKDFLQKY